MISFNKPHVTGNEISYISNVISNKKLSGDGEYTKKCSDFFKHKYGFEKTLLTTSCTDALEMAATLIGIEDGDEVIMPSYTFVSTANAFVLRGAKIRFCDSNIKNPNIDVNEIEKLITPKTKAIVVVHYAGIACDMDAILAIAHKYNIEVIEDAAQAIDSFYKEKPLGSIGALGTFSFHETKNIVSGEGGMLVINNEQYAGRAEIIREKGTNRSAFFRGEVDKYGWVDVGSSHLPSELISAYLLAQLEEVDEIQSKRIELWDTYYNGLSDLVNKNVELPNIPDYATNNAHMFYLITRSLSERNALIKFLKSNGVNSVFHYSSLHSSSYYIDKHDGRELPNSDRYSDTLLRLPLYYELTIKDVKKVIELIKEFYFEGYGAKI